MSKARAARPARKAAQVGLAQGIARGFWHSPLGKVAMRIAPIAVVGAVAWEGSTEDRNRVRGAARGALSVFDPTSIFMSRGVATRVFDHYFGEAEKPDSDRDGDEPQPVPRDRPLPRAIEASGTAGAHLDRAALERSMAARPLRLATARGVQPSPAAYERTYTRGPKAGTTELVRRV